MQSDESCKRHDPWVSVRLVVRIAGRILVALRVDAQQIDDTELGGDPNVVAAIFRLEPREEAWTQLNASIVRSRRAQ